MNILDRYIARSIVAATLVVLVILVSIDAAFALIGELEQVGTGDYRLAHAIWYVLLTLPRRAYLLFSTAVLLGSLVGLGTLATHSELVVMRAAGISNRRILRAAAQIGVILSLATLVLGEWAAPASEQAAQRLRASNMSGRVSVQGQDGLWIRDGTRYINVKRLLPGQSLQEVTIYEMHAGEDVLLATHARSGRYRDGQWILRDVRRSNVTSAGVHVEHRDEERWNALVDPALFDVLLVNPDSLSAVDLYRYVDHLRGNDVDAGRYELALWRKLSIPLTTLVMLLLALPFVFGSNRSAGAGHRLLIGSLIGIVYFLLDRLFSYIGLIYGLPPALSAFLPPLLFCAALVVLLRRAL